MDAKIKVLVRCRPFLANETNRRRSIVFSNDSVAIGDKKFSFEQVFDDNCCQRDVYDACVRSLVDGCFEGYNGTVFAYGQTGSGKTYSIMGSPSSTEEDLDPGIIPRALKQIFDSLHSKEHAGTMANIRVSMIELYNDECNDLLHPEIPSRDIMIREDKHGRIFFTGAREEVVNSTASALHYLELGNINRSTAETLMNQTSSRSHAIFTVSMEMVIYNQKGSDPNTNETEEESSFIHAKLHLVDLAGSERAKKTGASGVRLKESVGINQGLLSLGKVIRALTTTTAMTHVPYRESKLTRFLQDSLGGNSRTVLLACISPLEASLNETINTLQYASRAKAIHNKVIANVSTGIMNSDLQTDLESSLVVSLRAEIVRMQQEMKSILQQPSSGLQSHLDDALNHNDSYNSSKQRIRELEHKLHQQLQVLRSIRTTLQQAVITHESQPVDLFDICRRLLTLVSDTLLGHHQGSFQGVRKSINESIQDLPLSLSKPTHSTQQAMEEEIQTLREELQEAREDLQRDEEIFTEKIKELKTVRKQIKDLETENRQLKLTQATMQSQLVKLSKLPKMFLADTNFDLEESMISLTGTSPHKQRLLVTSPQKHDDLDVSIAVAMTEPDISQLMEDFEAVWKEKEDLLDHFKLTEDNLLKMETVAKQQTLKIAKTQEQFVKKIKMKDLLLKEKSREQQDTLDKLKLATQELQESRQQREQLQHDISSLQTLQTRQTHNDEVNSLNKALQEANLLRDKLQSQLREMEMEHEQLSRNSTYQIQDLNEALQEAKDREQKLLQRIDELKDDKEKLLDELEVSVKIARSSPQPHPPSSALSPTSSRPAENRPSTATLRHSHTEQLNGWLEESVAAVVEEGIAQIEVLRLEKALAIVTADRDAAIKELHSLTHTHKTPSAAMAAEHGYDTKLTAIDEKIRALKLKATNVRMKLLSNPQHEGYRKELLDIEYSMQTYEDHKAEFLERMQQQQQLANVNNTHDNDNVFTPQQLDLQDDIEAMNTEINVLEIRREQEIQHMHSLQESNYKRFAIGGQQELQNRKRKPGFALESIVHTMVADMQHYYTRLSHDKTTTNNKGEEPLDYLMAMALKMLIKHRIKAGTNESTWKETKAQLESKCVEYDNLVKTMQRMRNDAMKNKEQMKRECEDKVAFLVQQIRILENRPSSRASSIPAADRSGSGGIASDSPQLLVSSRSDNGLRSNVSQWLASRQSTSADGNRPSQSQGAAIIPRLRLSQKKSMSELMLQQEINLAGDDVNQEVVKRWIAEKERREQLERRIAEMARELRQLRGGNGSGDER